jgi:type II secretory pathway component PulM
MPTPDIIRVESLNDIQNTPKGQPMQLKTLAQEIAELRERQSETTQDMQLKQKVEDEQEREGMDGAPADSPSSN